MKTCTHCNLPLPLSSFHRNKAHADGHVSHCKPCRREIRLRQRETGTVRYYNFHELRYRPREHVMEVLLAADIAVALGIHHNIAMEIKNEPWTLDDEQDRRLRVWMESAA